MMQKDYKIIVVDFDNTLFKKGPEGKILEANEPLILALKQQMHKGNKLILNTTRWGDRLQDAVEACASKGLFFDAINHNLPEVIEYLGHDPRKIWGDVYIDDKAVSYPWLD